MARLSSCTKVKKAADRSYGVQDLQQLWPELPASFICPAPRVLESDMENMRTRRRRNQKTLIERPAAVRRWPLPPAPQRNPTRPQSWKEDTADIIHELSH